MKKNWIFVLIIILLIAVNLFYELRRGDYSSDPNDSKLTKISDKYQAESNDYNYQIINDILDKTISYIKDENSKAIDSIFDDSDTSTLENITNYSVQEIYKLNSESTTINFVKVYIEQSKKLDVAYFIIKQDASNETFSIKISNKEEYAKAQRNDVSIDLKFTINSDDFNTYEYDYDFTKIAYRYINDYYLKYTYVSEDAYKIDDNYRNYKEYMKNRVSLSIFDSNTVIDEGKSIEEDNITYYVNTGANEYIIKVYSPMKYKITIE